MPEVSGGTVVSGQNPFVRPRINLYAVAYGKDSSDYDELLRELKKKVLALRLVLYGMMYNVSDV